MLLSSVSKINLGAWEKTKTQRNQAFHILVLFFFSQCEECNLLLPLLRNGCCLVDSFAFWRFYKVLHGSIAWFWKYSNKLWGCSKPANLSFWNMKSFQQSILIKKNCVSDHQSRGKLTRLKTLFACGTWLAKCKAIYRQLKMCLLI